MKKLNISSFASPFLVTAKKDAGLSEIEKLMNEFDIRHIPIVDNNEKPVGIISKRELSIFNTKKLSEKFYAADIMLPGPYCIDEKEDIRDIVNVMLEKKIGSCLLMDGADKISGIFTMIDALKTLKILLDNRDYEPECPLIIDSVEVLK